MFCNLYCRGSNLIFQFAFECLKHILVQYFVHEEIFDWI